MNRYRLSPRWVSLAYVLVAGSPIVPVLPQSTPTGVQSPPSQRLPTSSAGPSYSPGLSTASSVGVASASGTVVVGTTVIVRSSELDPADGVSYVVVMVIVLFWLSGSVASVLVTANSTVALPPGASVPYGLDVASAVKPAGSVSCTSPVCGVVDQSCTLTGTVRVSPMPIDWAAGESPIRSARGAVVWSQLSYSCHLPQRAKRPSTGDTTRTTVSV